MTGFCGLFTLKRDRNDRVLCVVNAEVARNDKPRMSLREICQPAETKQHPSAACHCEESRHSGMTKQSLCIEGIASLRLQLL